MSAIQTPVKLRGGESRAAAPVHPRDEAIAHAVERCRPLMIRPSGRARDDVIGAAIDAGASGRAVYTFTDSEGLVRMAPALFRASHLGLPIVMTVRNATGRRDHGQAMALRDCGWVQLYPTDDQDAIDTHIQAFRIAEAVSLPVMICTDVFTGACPTNPLQVPSGAEIDAFLGRADVAPCVHSVGFDPRDQHAEMRYLTHAKQSVALETIGQVAADFRAHFGRRSGGIMTTHRLYAAKIVALGLGSTFEAITAVVEGLKEDRMSVGAIGLRSFRPLSTQTIAAALLHCQRVVIVERAVAVGIGGIVSTDVRSALARLPIQTHTVVAGLGDRAISLESLQRVLYQAAHGTLEELSFLDVNRQPVRAGRSVR